MYDGDSVVVVYLMAITNGSPTWTQSTIVISEERRKYTVLINTFILITDQIKYINAAKTGMFMILSRSLFEDTLA